MEVLSKRIEQFLDIGDGSGYGYGSGDGYGYGSGDGSGYGDGYGDGSGSGDGYGYGYGSGDGSGYGSGDGYGYGSGDGYGYGYGSGDGSGYGDGYGDGSGDGSGILEFDGHKVYQIDNIPTIITNIRGNIAQGYTIKYNSLLVPCYIAKVDNCFAHGVTAHQALRDATDKALQNKPIEDRIADVVKQYPDIDKPIPHKELYSLHNILTGSCEFGRREFAANHGLDPEQGEMTMRQFIDLTINAYGGDSIKELLHAYTTTF